MTFAGVLAKRRLKRRRKGFLGLGVHVGTGTRHFFQELITKVHDRIGKALGVQAKVGFVVHVNDGPKVQGDGRVRRPGSDHEEPEPRGVLNAAPKVQTTDLPP